MPSDQTRSVRTTWLYTLGSIVFFVGFFCALSALLLLETYLIGEDPVLIAAIAVQAVCAVTAIRFCWFLRVGRGGGLPHPGWTIALVVPAGAAWVIGLFAVPISPATGAPLWIAVCLIACVMPQRWRWPMIIAGALALVGHLFVAASIAGVSVGSSVLPGWSSWAVIAALLPFMLLSGLWWWEIVVELDRHRRMAGDLAVAQERLRFASDLHDIQGHHLQVISLKAELAERLLARDPEAARANIHEVQVIAREALEETRALVAGYRQVTLDDELENAREVLTASGAQCRLRTDDLPADAATRAALASIVREATTNILRHSSAKNVDIVLAHGESGWTLSVTNDGVHPTDAATPGSGLAGLRERLSPVGGTLGCDVSDTRFTLRAAVPSAAPVTTLSGANT
ncbi:sensor histidine kinase [Microbacterium koreense]|uniref:Sensor histidine kinase n=1 Tax=Microbacterium koreense TaxID=323761 RepID=A0ABW2ZPM0_9MICO